MDIQLVKRIANPSNKPIPKKVQPIEELEQPPTDTDAQLMPQPTVDATVPPRGTVEQQPTFYFDDSDDISNRPNVSVGNSGWQPSDIWRDLRIDDFCC